MFQTTNQIYMGKLWIKCSSPCFCALGTLPRILLVNVPERIPREKNSVGDVLGTREQSGT
jgi:hypothetical protein